MCCEEYKSYAKDVSKNLIFPLNTLIDKKWVRKTIHKFQKKSEKKDIETPSKQDQTCLPKILLPINSYRSAIHILRKYLPV